MVSHSGATMLAPARRCAITCGVPFISSARRRTSASTWPGVAPQHAGLQRLLGGAPERALRPAQLDARKARRAAEQLLGRGAARPGAIDAAQVGALLRDAVERGRGAEVDHDRRRAVERARGDRVGDAVGADRALVVVADRQALDNQYRIYVNVAGSIRLGLVLRGATKVGFMRCHHVARTLQVRAGG